MTEAALALSEQKVNNLGELLTKTKLERTDVTDRHSREMKKQQEVLRYFSYLFCLCIDWLFQNTAEFLTLSDMLLWENNQQ